MPSEFNHIDDFFRRKEGESRADLSAQDAHWSAMRTALKAGPKSATSGTWKWMAAAAAAVAVVASLVMTFTNTRSEAPKSIATRRLPPPAQAGNTVNAVPSAVPDKAARTANNDAPTYTHSRYLLPEQYFALPYPKVDTTEPGREKPEPQPPATYQHFFTALQKPAQVFEVNNSKDTTIYCAEGSILRIPAGTFETISGLAVDEQVEIRVREFYRMSDIIAANLTTMSDGAPLVTGGMLQIAASAAGTELRVRKGRSLNLSMPTKNFDSRMQLFTGSEKAADMPADTTVATGRVNWRAAGQMQRIYPNYLKLVPVFRYSDNPYKTSIRNPYNPSKVQTVARFRVPWYCPDSDEKVDSILRARYGRFYDIILIKRQRRPNKMKNRVADLEHKQSWYDSQMVGDTVSMHITTAMRLKYITREDSLAWEEKWRAQMRNGGYSSAFFQKNGFYEFELSTLGWINCDRFLEYLASQKTDLVFKPAIELNANNSTTVLLFRDLNVLMGPMNKGGKIRFDNILKGEKVVVISSMAKEGRFLVAIRELEVVKSPPITLEYQEMEPAAFRKLLRDLTTPATPD